MPHQLNVLGHDPGSKHYGSAVVSFRVTGEGKFQYKVRETNQLKNPVTELKGDLRKELKKYVGEVRKTVKKYKVNVLYAERFMSRGHGGTLIELVGVMLGSLFLAFPCASRVISSATWKNRVNAYTSLDKLYEAGKKKGLEAHEIDAACIAFYAASQHYGTENVLRLIKPKLVNEICKCTTSELRPPKKKKAKKAKPKVKAEAKAKKSAVKKKSSSSVRSRKSK